MKKLSIKMTSCHHGEKRTLEHIAGSTAYYQGAGALVNMVVFKNCMLAKRPGSYYITTLFDSSDANESPKDYKLASFTANNQNFILEFSVGLLRIYCNNKLLTQDDGTAYTLKLPYKESSDIANIELTKDNIANAAYIFCKGYMPQILKCDHNNEFSLDKFAFIDGPYQDINKSDTTLTPAAVSGSRIKITASGDIFKDSDKGRHIRLFHTEKWGYGVITRPVSKNIVEVEVKTAFESSTATTYWHLGAFNDQLGYP